MKSWNDGDLQLLQDLYCKPEIHIEDIAITIGRSRNAVHLKANRIGLSRPLEEGKKQNGREHEVHHIIARRKFTREHLAEANALENLITFCINCHRKLIYAGGDD